MWQMNFIARLGINKKEKIHTKGIFRNHQIAVLITSVTYNSARRFFQRILLLPTRGFSFLIKFLPSNS